MNFHDFINNDKKKYVQVPKIVKQPIKEKYEEPEEEYEEFDDDTIDDTIDEDYQEDEYYEKPIRKPPVSHSHRNNGNYTNYYRTGQSGAYPAKRQQMLYTLPEEQFESQISVSDELLDENCIENTANTLSETIKRKVDTVFYRFGIQGLKKLDEKILDTIDELQYPEEFYKQRKLQEMRRVPIIKKRKPLPIEQIKKPVVVQYKEPIEEYEPIEEEPVERPEPIQKVVSSPKPKFLQTPKTTTTQKPKFLQKKETSTETVNDEDLMEAVVSMDFNEKPIDEKVSCISDDEMWNTVGAILETSPSTEYKHEPQCTSVLPKETATIEEATEQKPVKKKRKTKVKKIEEPITNEEQEQEQK